MKRVIVAFLVIFTFAIIISPVLCEANSTGDLQQKFQGIIGNWLGFFETNVSWISASLLNFLKQVIKATYFTIGVLGFVLWSSGISKFTGKRLLLGAVALALVAEVLL